ncbi:hypothetical protein [Dietzia sp. Alg238-R159]|uniref:hypothetical protein n=1 Tax=Dietzia sp. Alg238-R159 TaxID=2305986 RepID=UPI0013D73CDA|nr:hypothetical protein [Dietzia sp. Alg238-R159]
MTSRIRRALAGGPLAAATATGIALAGAGTANAITLPPEPTHQGTEGEQAYYQGGGDPTIHRFTWTGGAWRYDGCVGVGYYEQVR